MTVEELRLDCLTFADLPEVPDPTQYHSYTPSEQIHQSVRLLAMQLRDGSPCNLEEFYKLLLDKSRFGFDQEFVPAFLYLSAALGKPVYQDLWRKAWFKAKAATEDEAAFLRRYWWHPEVARSVVASLAIKSEAGLSLYLECLRLGLERGQLDLLNLAVSCCNSYEYTPKFLRILKQFASFASPDLPELFFQAKSTQGVFFIFAYRPDLAGYFGATRLRKFPRYQHLSAWVNNPALATPEDRVALQSWQVYGSDFAHLWSEFNLEAPEDDVVVEETKVWSWEVTEVKLPGGKLQVDSLGILKGKQRIAWRLTDEKLLSYVSSGNATGRLYESMIRAYGLQSYGTYPDMANDKPVQASTPVSDMIQLTALQCWSFGGMHSMLEYMLDTPYYELTKRTFQPILELWITTHLFGRAKARLTDNLAIYGNVSAFMRVREHFPELIPPPSITAEAAK